MKPGEQKEINGTVSAAIYQNDENGYTVLRIMTDSGEEITVVGCIPFAAPGEELALRGEWSRHSVHGEQFKVSRAKRMLPSDTDGIYQYLSSGVIKGIGPATATIIVTSFGDESLDVIENYPEKLGGMKGISLSKARKMSESFRKQMGLRRLMEFLGRYGLSLHIAMRLYQSYGNAALERLKDNPYILTGEELGVGFAQADAMGTALGFEPDAPERITAAATFVLAHNLSNGHCFIPRDKLLAAVANITGIGTGEAAEALDILIDEEEVISEDVAGVQACYLSRLHEAECYVAGRIKLMTEPMDSSGSDDIDIDALIGEIESEQGITYAPLQRETLWAAASSQVMVITGGPGTGKTTSVRAIIALYKKLGLTVRLTAPTGRAAKRLSEVTGCEAYTVHRLLEAGYSGDSSSELQFRRCEENQLDTDVIILDETSMVDLSLMRGLLAAMPAECRLLMVGDADQLQPVGPGCVFLDIIRSETVKTVRLEKIFRQTEESRIVQNAHLINKGEHIRLSDNKGDFFFLRRTEPENIIKTITQLCSRRLPDNMGYQPMDIQVLCPTRRTEVGTVNLNQMLQSAINPPEKGKKEKQFGEIYFREGDRVMQTRNNYDIMWREIGTANKGLGIYNGDIGQITAINQTDETVTVCYDNRLCEYTFDMLYELEHAFAMTVHKSQGSEYKVVVLALQKGAPRLMTRSILYTAVTRARELLILVGSDGAVYEMIDNFRQTRRYSGLRARLTGE